MISCWPTRADGLAVIRRSEGQGLPATLGLRTYLGRAYQYQCETPAGPLIANGTAVGRRSSVGAAARLVSVPEQCCVLAPEQAVMPILITNALLLPDR